MFFRLLIAVVVALGVQMPFIANAQTLTTTFDISCADAASLYNTTGNCKASCGSGETNATAPITAALANASTEFKITTSLCSAGTVCCVPSTVSLTAPPDLSTLSSLLNKTSGSPSTGRTAVQKAPVGNPGASGLINPLGTVSVTGAIGRAVSWLGGLAGSLFFGMLLWGGIQWMTAGGDPNKVKSGQGRILASVAGIAVVLLAYMIVASLIGVLPQ